MTDFDTSQWQDAELVQIAALQHYSYCPRQCALIHVEQCFDENIHTLRGRAVHKQVDIPETERQNGVRIERASPLYHDGLGLIGKADVVEFHGDGRIVPVEYKHGRKKISPHDQLQLAAQALCLEAMNGLDIPEGSLYYYSSRRRLTVPIDQPLRARLEQTISAVRQLQQTWQLPPPVNDKRCAQCSLKESCQPQLIADARRIKQQHAQLFRPQQDVQT